MNHHPQRTTWSLIAGLAIALLASGCGSKSSEKSAAKSSSSNSQAAKSSEQNTVSLPGGQSEPGKSTVRKPLSFGGSNTGSETNGAGNSAKTANTGRSAIRRKLQPLQVVVGEWDGLTRKKLAGAVGVESPAWRWDFTKPEQPALAFDSKTSPYLKAGRITFLPEKDVFQMTATLKDGSTKTYEGKLTEPVRDVPAEDGKKLDRTFTLTFTQVAPVPENSERNYQIAFQQMKNDRYLMITHRKTGDRVFEWDRVGNQRKGTSFAAKLDDYGDKTCVVSQGLGTTTVSHNGKTYYVCCSGCQKAFEADPEKWIASYEEWKKANGKK